MERVPQLNTVQLAKLSKVINSKSSSFIESKKAQTIFMLNNKVPAEQMQMLTGYSRRHSFALHKTYLTQWLVAIQDKKRKQRSLLTKAQLGLIEAAIKASPSGYGYKAEYWSASLIADYIKVNFGVNHKSKTSIRLLFKKAYFTYHKPNKKYQRRDKAAVQKWNKETQLIIQKAWDEANTVIFAEDEMVLSTQTTTQRVWLRYSEYPKTLIDHP